MADELRSQILGDYTLVIAETERAEEQVDTALEPVALCKHLVVLISGIRKLKCLCAGLPLSPEKPHNSDERPNQEDAVERWRSDRMSVHRGPSRAA